ncbi:MAG: GntR family transcriptional regulator [Lachnospiraceae bacterium]|nr:GntR family transcriptional regulator [Lachnospiraceae bacterium]MEE0685627.1 GntR family transcriptional regulator [Lachnospiraceae bacterium]MEE0863387.1 GntR family transcriptional regulator [Lachnospiraceae bacterium]
MKDISLKMDEYLPLRDVVFNTLRNAILTGELSPGERLMEIKLADKLGVSRTPIREAIRKLELEGLVVNTPRKGAEVANISAEDLRDVLEVRRSLEVLAIRLACDKMTEETLELLHENIDAFKHSIDAKATSDIASVDVSFHDIIYKSTGNNRLIQILNNISEQMYRYRFEYIKNKEAWNRLVEEHMNIYEAIKNRDKELAVKSILLHIDNQERDIRKKMGFDNL